MIQSVIKHNNKKTSQEASLVFWNVTFVKSYSDYVSLFYFFPYILFIV